MSWSPLVLAECDKMTQNAPDWLGGHSDTHNCFIFSCRITSSAYLLTRNKKSFRSLPMTQGRQFWLEKVDTWSTSRHTVMGYFYKVPHLSQRSRLKWYLTGFAFRNNPYDVNLNWKVAPKICIQVIKTVKNKSQLSIPVRETVFIPKWRLAPNTTARIRRTNGTAAARYSQISSANVLIWIQLT